MDNISKSIAQLIHILERHNYPKDRKFHEELKKVLDEKTGNDKLSKLCLAILEQK